MFACNSSPRSRGASIRNFLGGLGRRIVWRDFPDFQAKVGCMAPEVASKADTCFRLRVWHLAEGFFRAFKTTGARS